jgi:quercetin dioxygenase-like cupin family protein
MSVTQNKPSQQGTSSSQQGKEMMAESAVGSLCCNDECTQLLCENPEARITLVTIAPRMRSPLHTNRLPHLTIPLTNGTLQMLDKDMKKITCCAGQSVCCSPQVGQSEMFVICGEECHSMVNIGNRFPCTHCVENMGDKPYMEIVVEMPNYVNSKGVPMAACVGTNPN